MKGVIETAAPLARPAAMLRGEPGRRFTRNMM